MRPSLLRFTRVASDRFPSPASVLPLSDPWSLPLDELAPSSRTAPRIAAVLAKQDAKTAWQLFAHHRRQFSIPMLGRLLAILPSGAETAHVWWPRALEIRHALAEAQRAGSANSSTATTGTTRGPDLSPENYAVLINLAAKTGDLESVEALWAEMRRWGVLRDTNVWNQYISAVCDADARFWPWPRGWTTNHARVATNARQRAAGAPSGLRSWENGSHSASAIGAQGMGPSRSGSYSPDTNPNRYTSESFLPPLNQDQLSDVGTQNSNHVREPGHVFLLLDRMEVEGVERNAATMSLVLLALAREGHALRTKDATLVTMQKVINRLWIQPAEPLCAPTLQTLTAVVNSFAFHDELVAGCRLAQQIIDASAARRHRLGLDLPAANMYWTRLLRLIVVQTKPRGQVPQEFFGEVWDSMTQIYGFKPTWGCHTIRAEFLEMKNQFDDMLAALPAILALTDGATLAHSVLKRALTGLANTGRAMDAVKQLQWAKTLDFTPSPELEAMLASKGATVQQLQLFEEDDDEDSIIG